MVIPSGINFRLQLIHVCGRVRLPSVGVLAVVVVLRITRCVTITIMDIINITNAVDC